MTNFYISFTQEELEDLVRLKNLENLLPTLHSIFTALLSHTDVPYDLILMVIVQARKHQDASAVVGNIQEIEQKLKSLLQSYGIDLDTINTDLDTIMSGLDTIKSGIFPLSSMAKRSICNDARYGASTIISVAAAPEAAIKVVLDEILGSKMEISLGVFRHLTCSEEVLVSHLYYIVQKVFKRAPVDESSHLMNAIKFLERAGLM